MDNYLLKRTSQTKRLTLFILLTLFFGIMMPFPPTLAQAATTLPLSNSSSKRMFVEQLTIKDEKDTPVTIGEEENFLTSISDVLAVLDAGEVGGSQSALFETLEDKQKCIIKNIVDVVANPISTDMDLVIVLDVSGSMSSPLPGGGYLSELNTRIGVAKQAILQLSESILSADGNNRISVVAFSTTVDATLDCSSDQETIHGFISRLSTGRSTNYESGLNQAEAFLNGRTEAEISRKSSVILITDGQPSHGDALAGANRLKANTNADLYCVGIASAANDLLSSLATDDNHFRDCTTVTEFMDYMSQVTRQLSLSQSATIWTEIGRDFTLFSSEAYPITIGEDVYSSIDDIPSDQMQLTTDQGKIQWNIPDIDRSGTRFSYYTVLTDEARADLSLHPIIPVINTSSLEYHSQYRGENGVITTSGELTSVALPVYSLSAVLKSSEPTPSEPATPISPRPPEPTTPISPSPVDPLDEGIETEEGETPVTNSIVPPVNENTREEASKSEENSAVLSVNENTVKEVTKLEGNDAVPSVDKNTDEEVTKPGDNSLAQSETPNFRQPAFNQQLQDTTYDSYLWLVSIIAVLATVFIVQLISIDSDLRILKWYQSKKNEFLQ